MNSKFRMAAKDAYLIVDLWRYWYFNKMIPGHDRYVANKNTNIYQTYQINGMLK